MSTLNLHGMLKKLHEIPEISYLCKSKCSNSYTPKRIHSIIMPPRTIANVLQINLAL